MNRAMEEASEAINRQRMNRDWPIRWNPPRPDVGLLQADDLGIDASHIQDSSSS
jgi:hypothetical protein